jgi:hypothetical protein
MEMIDIEKKNVFLEWEKIVNGNEERRKKQQLHITSVPLKDTSWNL